MPTVRLTDYSADISGSWSAAFVSAINDAGIAGKIIVPAGLYPVALPIYPKADQVIEGEGREITTIRIMFNNIAAWGVGECVFNGADTSPGVTISGITFNGGRSDSGVADYIEGPTTPKDTGGGVGCRVRWTVRDCRFTNINGFKVALFGAHGAVVQGNIFDCDAPGTGGQPDNIGGGAGASGIRILDNHFTPTAKGSAIDITNASDVWVINNTIEFRSLILEGVTGGRVEGNLVMGVGTGSDKGNINLKSNGAYASSIDYGVFHCRDIDVIGNTVIGSEGAPGIVVSYTNSRLGPPLDAATPGAFLRTGGNNKIMNNTVINTKSLGIVVFGDWRGKSVRDVISDNYIADITGTTWGSGIGTFKSCGIGIGVGTGDIVYRNKIVNCPNGICLGTSGTHAPGAGRVSFTHIMDTICESVAGAVVVRP